MIRIAGFLAILTVLVQAWRALGPPARWGGYHEAVLWACLLGAVIGSLAGTLLRLALRRSAPAPRAARAVALVGRPAALAGLVLLAVLAVGAARDAAVPSPLGALRPAGAPGTTTAAPGDDQADDPRGADRPRLVVIGLDGATWNLVEPLMAAGRLPNLRRLLADGVGGVLRSVEESHSPEVWTTIFTGKTPAQHGIDSWVHARADRRRCRILWQLLEESGGRALVANVPGTCPADPLRGVMMAGFPTRREIPSNLGTIFSTRPADTWQVPARELRLREEEGVRHGALVLREEAVTLRPRDLWVARCLPPGAPSRWFAGRLRRRFARIPFAVRGDTLRLLPGGEGGAEAGPLPLAVGDWSPWLLLDRADTPLVLRVRLLELDGGSVSLYATPLFGLPADEAVRPGALARRLADAADPYVSEGGGWTMFREPRLLGALVEHLDHVADGRYRHVRRLWRAGGWESLIYVITLTDRLQHSLWPWLPDAFHARVGPPLPYPEPGPPAAVGAELPDAIPDAYAWADCAIGELLREAGPETVVAVVSDHGFQSPPAGADGCDGIHHPDGIYLFAGGPFRRTGTAGAGGGGIPRPDGPVLELVDVTPTLLAALGRPVAADFAGRVAGFLTEALRARGAAIDTIPTYEDGTAGAEPAEVEDATLEQIRSLGYVD